MSNTLNNTAILLALLTHPTSTNRQIADCEQPIPSGQAILSTIPSSERFEVGDLMTGHLHRLDDSGLPSFYSSLYEARLALDQLKSKIDPAHIKEAEEVLNSLTVGV